MSAARTGFNFEGGRFAQSDEPAGGGGSPLVNGDLGDRLGSAPAAAAAGGKLAGAPGGDSAIAPGRETAAAYSGESEGVAGRESAAVVGRATDSGGESATEPGRDSAAAFGSESGAAPDLREVKVEDAVGMMLAHDLTQILPGRFKGRLFRKGHVIRAEDIPALLSIGKEHIYTMRLTDGWLHEDEAAQRMAQAIAGSNLTLTDPHEGKISLKSEIHGLAKLDKAFIDEVNAIDQIVLSTLKTNTVVQPKQAIAGTRVVPLVVEASRVERVEALARQWKERHGADAIASVKPFRKLRVGLITTGSEVFKGRIEDKFGPAVRSKVADLGSEVIEQRLAPDDSETIAAEIRGFLERGAELVLVTGGMSVDPDDRTPGAIRRAGAQVVSYGTPMLPGSMLMMAYIDGVPVMGLPGCVMHDPYTSFDVLLPRICAGETIKRQDIVDMGYGGLYGC